MSARDTKPVTAGHAGGGRASAARRRPDKTPAHPTTSPARRDFRSHEHRILLLQGGGALGAYHGGVYEGLAGAGFAPDWVVGISVGAINAALIAGNAPARRVERLRAFWDRVSAPAPIVLPTAMDYARPAMNRMAAASAMFFGIPGFFVPRVPPPQLGAAGTVAAMSYYDTEPLRGTLEELVDFDRINAGEVRLSLGAVNVRTGESVYFDNRSHRITASHVMASGALPPGFPPVEVDGEFYLDGGIMSNTPLQHVAQDYRMDALIVAVDLFSGLGVMPRNLAQVQERVKDIQFQSKTRLTKDHVREFEGLRSALAYLLDKVPASLREDPQIRKLEEVSRRGPVSLIHLINRHDTQSSDFKDYEFSRATVGDLWAGGREDIRSVLDHPAECRVSELGNGVRVVELPS